MIESDIQKLAPGELVELFTVDLNPIGVNEIYNFHAGVNGLNATLIWQGVDYTRFPIEASGFDKSGSGSIPRPTIRVANITGLLDALARENDDLVGAKFIRRRTFSKYLDAVNFPGGINPSADPNVHLDDEIWFIDRKASVNKVYVEWELAAAFDLSGVKLPRRQVIQNICTWQYRSAECSYAGDPVAMANDTLTTDPTKDVCGKRLSSCKLRFGDFNELPYGGFPGAASY